MEESDEPNKPPGLSPEEQANQLLRLLEIQQANLSTRSRPRESSPSVLSFRYLSLIVLVVGTFVAVGFLEWMASQIPKRPQIHLLSPPVPPGR